MFVYQGCLKACFKIIKRKSDLFDLKHFFLIKKNDLVYMGFLL